MFKKTGLRLLCALLLLTAALATFAQPSRAAQGVTLKYVSWMSKGEDKPILAEFMKKYPNIKVEDQVLDGATYDQLIKPRFIAKDAPDVLLFMPFQYQPFVAEGWLMDVTNEPGTKQMDALKSLAASYTIGGKVYGTMVNGLLSDQPIYYNKKYFAKLGITPPTTVDEFLAAAEKIKADGKDPLVFGGKDVWPLEFIFTRGYFVTQQLNKFNGADPDIKLIKGEATIKDVYGSTFDFFSQLVSKGYIGPASQSLTYDQSVQYFIDGKAGMLPQGPWIAGLDVINKADPATFELGAFAFPHDKIDGKIRVSGSSDRNIGIWSGTKHPEEAKLLYNFFLSKENLKTYLETQSLGTLVPGIDPKVAPALADYAKAQADPTKYEIFIGSTDDSVASIPPAWKAALDQVYSNILAGATVDEELKRLQGVWDQVKDSAKVNKK
jgi:raffinose/stachyose/melibiose transport system substrate-binding protein